MESNPYKSPNEITSENDPNSEEKHRGCLFMVLGLAVIVCFLVANVAILFDGNSIGPGLVAMAPIGFLGIAAFLHGMRPSQGTTKAMTIAIGVLVLEIIFLMAWL